MFYGKYRPQEINDSCIVLDCSCSNGRVWTQVTRGRETKNMCEIFVGKYKILVLAGSCCLSLPDITPSCVGGMLIGLH